MENKLMQPSEEAIKEALNHPNGWVYVIDKKYQQKENVPPNGILGAWKVGQNGHIEGSFIPNPNYR